MGVRERVRHFLGTEAAGTRAILKVANASLASFFHRQVGALKRLRIAESEAFATNAQLGETNSFLSG